MENNKWILELECKPDFEMAMKRVYAWYEQEIIDRAPIRFSAHNEEFSHKDIKPERKWNSLKDRWFDAEFQVESYMDSIKGRKFLAETFPVFWPNLGPDVYAAFYGTEMEYKEVTTFSIPIINDWDDIIRLELDMQNKYFKKIEELTYLALERCNGKFMVGFTDLMPGMDCVAAWRNPQQLCIDMCLDPDKVKQLGDLACRDFHLIYDHFDDILKKNNQLSVTWMGIPSFSKMHIPSCDNSAMISIEQFEEFCLPSINHEVKGITHNIFHLDGKGVARHVDIILQIKEINAIQWVQGMGMDTPILQWVPLLKKIQAAGKSLVVDIQLDEIEDFIRIMDPKGIMLCISADEAIQPDIIKRVEKW
ncbi:MAG: hypothetical protein A2X05_00430 [Bacteroidetes bacterium GWE2_41_25]|nr:MAG: hypothetical protein A2X03_11170 [Bacteroidetes bacterium GWA2_40_15]OFX96451.1 MAG: hypothetical protein A2X06_16195 [Bacteroidetes bacterium GWC2_40_22]OFX97140.1 MAG: hypothetical protein A2X05_00430 [Bacteroidetes bacterium GWE2_41_25]HBH82589.1 hypothetical protein [Bacteroidales bacterium]HBQ81702.1 hypothetical protein [Bacteroidales bacterium]